MKRRRVQELESLYVTHFGAAKRFAYLLSGDESSAEDMAQEAFVRMFSSLTRVKAGAALPAYLRRTIVNLANDRGRRQSRERRFHSSLPADPVLVSFSDDIDQRDEIWRALQRLPYRQRVAIILRYHEDLSEIDTAEVMDCSTGSVKSYTSRGLKKLRNHIQEVARDG